MGKNVLSKTGHQIENALMWQIQDLIEIDSRSDIVFVFICDQKHHPKVIWKENTYHAIFDKIIVINNFDTTTLHIVLCFLANFCNYDLDVLGLVDD